MKIVFALLSIATVYYSSAQNIDKIINAKEAGRIESTLASDDMRGRLAGTPDIDRAASFIADEFKHVGLQPLQGNSFMQEFTMIKPKLISLKAQINGKEIDAKNILVVTSREELNIDEKSGYEIRHINAGANFYNTYQSMLNENKNLIVFTDSSFARYIQYFRNNSQQTFKKEGNVVFIIGDYSINDFKLKAESSFTEMQLKNVAGILPGKSRKNEYVIFSGHYDHLGVGKPVNNDSIYNGANDDAAGTTAVIMLANYYKQLNNNERSMIFVAFTAEEEGGFGSQYFSHQLDPAQVVAMFNIEMIGTESKWGKNSAYITGYEKTDMGEIMQQNLKGTSFIFYPDPYTKENLFYRSDNATLARQGVPAHTISTSKMDNEPNYHQLSDEVKTLDMQNMAEIIKAIAISSRSIIAGKDTPARVKADSLN